MMHAHHTHTHTHTHTQVIVYSMLIVVFLLMPVFTAYVCIVPCVRRRRSLLNTHRGYTPLMEVSVTFEPEIIHQIYYYIH